MGTREYKFIVGPETDETPTTSTPTNDDDLITKGYAETAFLTTDNTVAVENKTIDADSNTISNLAHGAEVDNPTSGVHGVTGSVVGTSDSQVLTNKDIDGGTASNTSRVTLPKAAKATLDGLTRKEASIVYAADLKKAYIDDGSALTVIGSGSGSGGSVNYITNPDAETGADGWATYNDGASATPVDGTGGSATITWTRDTTAANILVGSASFLMTKGAGDCKGHGASSDFTIPLGYRNILHGLTFIIKSSAAYAAGDVVAYLYDKDTSTLITPSVTSVPADTVGGSGIAATFTVPNKTSSNYRLILHVATTNASAWTLSVDQVKVGFGDIQQASAVGPWTDIASTISKPTGLGTGSGAYSYYRWRRNGSNIDIDFHWTKDSSAGTGTSYLAFPLPPGYTMAGNLVNFGNALTYMIAHSTAAPTNNFQNTAVSSSSGLLILSNLGGSGNVAGNAIGANAQVRAHVSVPVNELSSSVMLASEATKSPAKAGFIQAYAGAAAPSGWQLCDGTQLLIASYPQLYAAIGTTWNTSVDPLTGSAQATPSSGYFRVPNLAGTFLRGVGNFTDDTKDVTLGGYQADQLKAHTHGAASYWTSGGSTATAASGSGLVLRADSPPSSAAATETRPQNVGVTYIVKLYDDSPASVAGFNVATVSQPIGLLQAGAIPGATDGSAAAEGMVGESYKNTPAVVTATNGVYTTIGSTALPAGRWLVTAAGQITSQGTGLTNTAFRLVLKGVNGTVTTQDVAYTGSALLATITFPVTIVDVSPAEVAAGNNVVAIQANPDGSSASLAQGFIRGIRFP